MKKCKICKIEKEEIDFYRNHDECKSCWLIYCKIKRDEKKLEPGYREKRTKYLQEWRKKNPEKEKGYTKKYFDKDKDKINERRRTPERRKTANESVKNWRKENPEQFRKTERERKSKNKIKTNAVNLIYKHIMRGHMVRGTQCEICKCKEGKMEAHHDDYSKPLEVRWVCRVCHRHEHGKLMDIK